MIEQVQKAQEFTGETSTMSLTATFAAAPTAGNLLIAFAAVVSGSTAPIPPAGWSVAVESSANHRTAWIWKVAGSSESTEVTITTTSNRAMSLSIFEYSGIASPVVDAVAWNASSGAVTSLTTGTTPATTRANALAMAGVIAPEGAGNVGFANIWTNEFARQTYFSSPIAQQTTAHKILSATGTQETTESWSVNHAATAAIAVFASAERDPANILPYSVLSGDPTRKANICWIDEDPAANGAEQVLHYGVGAFTASAAATSTLIPHTSAYVYQAELTGLTPDTQYQAEIRSGAEVLKTLPPFRTFPLKLGAGSLKMIFVSDTHIDLEWVMNAEQIQPLADHQPDILLHGGDLTSGGQNVNEANSNHWLRWWREYYSRFNTVRLTPMTIAPGNHDVGNGGWEGTGPVTPTAGYLQFFFPVQKALVPVGTNYCSIKLGDYLQILVLDTQSALPESVRLFLQSSIDTGKRLCLPIHHAPLLAGGIRDVGDPVLQDKMRRQWARLFAEAGNIKAHFCGHIHVRKRSVPWGVADSDPGGDRFELGNGYLHESPGGIIEFGDGWHSNRTPYGDEVWWLDYSTNGNQFFMLTLSNDSLLVESRNADGTVFHAFAAPLASSDGFTAEDRAMLAAIQAKTDNLPASPASTEDVQVTVEPTLTPTQATQLAEAHAEVTSETHGNAKLLEAVGEIEGGGTDWTDDEKEQIRHQLGIDGDKQAPTVLEPPPVVVLPPDEPEKSTAYLQLTEEMAGKRVHYRMILPPAEPAEAIAYLRKDLLSPAADANGLIQFDTNVYIGATYEFWIDGGPKIAKVIASDTTPIPLLGTRMDT